MTGSGLCIGAMGDLGVFQYIQNLEEAKEEMNQVTPEDIQGIAAHCAPERRWKLFLRK